MLNAWDDLKKSVPVYSPCTLIICHMVLWFSGQLSNKNVLRLLLLIYLSVGYIQYASVASTILKLYVFLFHSLQSFYEN